MWGLTGVGQPIIVPFGDLRGEKRNVNPKAIFADGHGLATIDPSAFGVSQPLPDATSATEIPDETPNSIAAVDLLWCVLGNRQRYKELLRDRLAAQRVDRLPAAHFHHLE
jgi:hypothetical protein